MKPTLLTYISISFYLSHLQSCLGFQVPSSTQKSSCESSSTLSAISRRQAILSSTAALTAETNWRTFVNTASLALESNSIPSTLPEGTLQTIKMGKAVIIPNWISNEETSLLLQDAQNCFQSGHFTNFILSRNKKKADKEANDRWIMPSFASKQRIGPFMDDIVGDLQVRNSLKRKMATVKAELAKGLDRPSLYQEKDEQTHEMEYLRYGIGALLNRHTDEHHLELKRPHGSKLPLKENASRRSVTWLVYLNDDWNPERDGGQLRLHEREYESTFPVGAAIRNDLQVGWLKANPSKGLGEQPVFLDPNRDGPENETCVLYTFEKDGTKRDLSKAPFANLALYLGGGDAVARKLMIDNTVDAERFHLIDAPKSLVSSLVKSDANDKGQDGGEKIKDIYPSAGTLVLFDSVSLPHEVLQTDRERFGVQGWFHEHIYTSADA